MRRLALVGLIAAGLGVGALLRQGEGQPTGTYRRFVAPNFTTAAAPTCNTASRGYIYFDTTLVELRRCDGTSYATLGTFAAFDLTAEHTFTGLNNFVRTAAGNDVCFGNADGTANNVCINGGSQLITFDGTSGDSTIDGAAGGSLSITANALALQDTSVSNVFNVFAQVTDFTGTTENNVTSYSAVLNAFNGDDTIHVQQILVTNANHTGTGNVLNGLDIATITQDAQATETAIKVETGWDRNFVSVGATDGTVIDFMGLTGSTARFQAFTNAGDYFLEFSPTDDVIFLGDAGVDVQIQANAGNPNLTLTTIPVAGAGGTIASLTATLTAMDGTDTVNGLAINLTNANHTGAANTNQVNALTVGGITGDANAEETAILFGAGWDTFARSALGVATNFEFATAGGAGITVRNDAIGAPGEAQILASGNSGTSYSIFKVIGVRAMNGSDTEKMFDVAITNSNHTSTGNELIGFSATAMTGDVDANEVGVVVGTGWDYAMRHAGIAFAALGTPTNGTWVYCTDCVVTTPFVNSTCTSGGSGSFAFRQASAWICIS